MLSPFSRNVPGQGPISGEHSKQLSYYIPQGEFTYPGNGFSSWSAYSQVLLSPRLQLGIGRVRSSQQPPMGRSYHPAFCQMAPSPLANILYCPHHSNSSHLQNPEPVTATDSHYQNLTGVQHAVGGSYNWQIYLYLPFLVAVSNRRTTGLQPKPFSCHSQAHSRITVYISPPLCLCSSPDLNPFVHSNRVASPPTTV